MSGQRGFTIVELMVSMTIFSVIIIGMTLALVQQQRQFNFTKEGVDIDQSGRAAIDFIASEFKNTASRQGKHFSVSFVNGGSISGGVCSTVDTIDDGTVDSPPDCVTLFTWDITRGQDGDSFPSVSTTIEVTQKTSPLKIALPANWFPASSPPLLSAGDLVGFRSRIKLCSTNASIVCRTTPSKCAECAAILRVASVNTGSRTGTFKTNLADLVVAQNFQSTAFADVGAFLGAFTGNVTNTVAEMGIVRSTTISVDTVTNELLVERNLNGTRQQYAGGIDAPGVVDLQLVLNLHNPDGTTTKVGVPTVASDLRFAGFASNAALLGREMDIRTVEIYLLMRSKLKPQLPGGQAVGGQDISQLGDRLKRSTTHGSLGEGYMYKLYNTIVYMRNMGREDFG